MTIFGQFRRENSIISILPLKIVNFGTKIQIDTFQDFVVFGQKMDLWHTVASFSSIHIHNTKVDRRIRAARELLHYT